MCALASVKTSIYTTDRHNRTRRRDANDTNNGLAGKTAPPAQGYLRLPLQPRGRGGRIDLYLEAKPVLKKYVHQQRWSVTKKNR